jgi:farnesyl diphosphate synthase
MQAVESAEPEFLKALEDRLSKLIPVEGDHHPRLQAAMRHAILGGGKRLRPLMVRAASQLGNRDDSEAVLLAAASVELLHGYSLVHDDLPAMDDDDYRRGRPSCHKEYGEAMGILAGDALQALAFEVLALALESSSILPEQKLELLKRFSITAGSTQLVGGQAADLEAREGVEGQAALLWIHERKTAALFRLCLRLGGAFGGLDDSRLDKLDEFGRLLGLAFQTVDDVLDASAERSDLGKTPGKDRKQGKLTFVEHYGLEEAEILAEENLTHALKFLPDVKSAETLHDLALKMVRRKR